MRAAPFTHFSASGVAVAGPGPSGSASVPTCPRTQGATRWQNCFRSRRSSARTYARVVATAARRFPDGAGAGLRLVPAAVAGAAPLELPPSPQLTPSTATSAEATDSDRRAPTNLVFGAPARLLERYRCAHTLTSSSRSRSVRFGGRQRV